MKRIRVTDYTPPDPTSDYTDLRRHSTMLNGKPYVFTAKRSLTDFMADTGNFLTQIGHEVNSLYADVFKAYRRVWVCSGDRYGRPINQDVLARIKVGLSDVDKILDTAFEKSFYDDAGLGGNVFSMEYLLKAIDKLLYSSNIIVEFWESTHRDAVSKVEARGLNNYIKYLKYLVVTCPDKLVGGKTEDFEIEIPGD